MDSATPAATSDDRRLRPPRWGDLPRAARMMAKLYLAGPGARLPQHTRRLVEALLAIAFHISLAVYRPLVRYWADPHDKHRQIVVSIIPNRASALPVLRLLVGVAITAAVLLGTTNLAQHAAAATIALLLLLIAAAVVVVAAALLTATAMVLWPYPGRIDHPGPRVPGTQLTAGLAASTTTGGMRAVRAYLLEHHEGQRLTVTARDTRAQAIYERLGLTVVAPGSGRMTGIITQA